MQRAGEAASSCLVKLGKQGLSRLLTGVVGELHGDGLGGAQRLLTIQAFDGFLGLVSLVEPNETYSARYTCSRQKGRQMLAPSIESMTDE